MPMADSLSPDSRFMGLFVGKSGCGKTAAAASFRDDANNEKSRPGIPRTMIFDFDGRIRGLLGCPWVNRSRIEYVSFPPRVPKGGKPNFMALNDHLEAIQNNYITGRNELDTVILDSLTSTAFAMILDALPLTHVNKVGQDKGRAIGSVLLPGMEDYGYEANAIYSLMSFFRSIPIKNIIVTAHIVPTYGKADPDDPYSPSIENGSKLSVRDKVGANVLIYFDHVFEFSRLNNGLKHYVRFKSDLARTSYSGLPDGNVDITNKNFYDYLISAVNNKGAQK